MELTEDEKTRISLYEDKKVVETCYFKFLREVSRTNKERFHISAFYSSLIKKLNMRMRDLEPDRA